VKVGGYTIMKKVVKSTFVLVNGSKISSGGGCGNASGGELMNMVTRGRMLEVKKRYVNCC